MPRFTLPGGSLIAVTALLLAGCDGTPSAGASCAGPVITVTPSRFAAGDEVRLEGKWLFDDCYDTGQRGTPPATRDVEFRLVPSGDPGRTFLLTTTDAARDGTVDTEVRIPDDVPPGPARVEVPHCLPTPVVVDAG
jgi:hypothetical protein